MSITRELRDPPEPSCVDFIYEIGDRHPALFREGRDIRTSEQQCSGHIHTLGSTVTARGTVV
jgi:hypothetical protein